MGRAQENTEGLVSENLAAKIRVHELAKELGLTNKECLDLCLALGIGVKTHSSGIEEAQADRVRRRARRDGLVRDHQPEAPSDKTATDGADDSPDGDKAAAKKAPAKKAAAKKAPAKKAAGTKKAAAATPAPAAEAAPETAAPVPQPEPAVAAESAEAPAQTPPADAPAERPAAAARRRDTSRTACARCPGNADTAAGTPGAGSHPPDAPGAAGPASHLVRQRAPDTAARSRRRSRRTAPARRSRRRARPGRAPPAPHGPAARTSGTGRSLGCGGAQPPRARSAPSARVAVRRAHTTAPRPARIIVGQADPAPARPGWPRPHPPARGACPGRSAQSRPTQCRHRHRWSRRRGRRSSLRWRSRWPTRWRCPAHGWPRSRWPGRSSRWRSSWRAAHTSPPSGTPPP